MCVSAAAFFYRGAGDVVNPEDVILNCYRLAERYHQNPDIFVEMPLSKIDAHIYYTVRLIEVQNKARERGED